MTDSEIRKKIVRQMRKALDEMERSFAWHSYTVMSKLKYHTKIDGDFLKRKWWFILREIE